MRRRRGVLRIVAGVVLGLYPKPWRERYGEEVADLVDSRPVRLRTVADLAGGVADAWVHHRRVPGARPPRVPLPAILAVGAGALGLLWNPGVRDAASLHGVWERAAGAGAIAAELHRTATALFAMAGLLALLSLWQVAVRVRAAGKDAQERAIRGRMVMVAALVAVPAGFVVAAYVGLGFLDVGHPVGPLAEAMLGGFFSPIVMALVLPLPLTAAASPRLADAVRAAGKSLAVAAILNAIAWLAVAALLAIGLRQASPWFAMAVAASALVSTGMAALVARAVLRRAPHDPVGPSSIGRLPA
ncbi:hypothetical protein ACFWY5_15240 [Nonomuraea sp. NPDC059007]|uniref:hypothetical protein n=1 Tax=Nonomuraea sp. NPDC059007 TaxID=3346692 RepID=UPI00368C0484